MAQTRPHLPEKPNQARRRAPVELPAASAAVASPKRPPKPPMMRQYDLVERVRRYNPHTDEALLDRAYVYAMKAHGEQKRASGDPYFSHPLEVAAILTDLKLDDATIAAALLHDTIEDTPATRAEIDAGRASGLVPLAFVADRMDAFFLEIQGSGRVALADGSVLRVGYADQNGHPYTPVARVLIERGEMTREEASMQAIRAWGERNPMRLDALLHENRSRVFFREVPAPAPGSLEAAIDGPIGALGVPLLAHRTIAVDPRAVPLGAPAWLATEHPLTRQSLERLVIAQDTGGAIRGAVRADLFWGAGPNAAEAAGRMRASGALWLLWPRDATLPSR